MNSAKTDMEGMPDEIDFSAGTRGKFHSASSNIRIPVYLDAEIQTYLSARAQARGIDVTQLVNELLKKDIELIESVR